MKNKKNNLIDRLPSNEGERLELMIKLTKRAIEFPEHEKDIVNQLKRLEKELKEWKRKYKS